MATNKELADRMYGNGAVNATPVNKTKVNQQGAGDSVKRKQVKLKATKTDPKGGM